jgi:large subunit ribosomal protein L25
MEQIVLQAKKRQVVGKQVRALRRQGLLPAVIYGHNFDPINITLDYHDASRALPGITSSSLLQVDVEGESYTVLVREKQRQPVNGSILHVDFMAVSLTEKLRATVGIELNGEAPASKLYGGIVVAGTEELEVECLPGDLPSKFVVDLTALKNIGDSLYVRDLVIPERVTILTNPGELVVIISAPAGEAEEVAAGTIEPEVIERGKKEEEA